MKNNNSTILFTFSQEVIDKIINMAIHTHNENIRSNQEPHRCGIASAYYEVYSLMQMQAEAFLIPLATLGLEKLKENDFLSISIITEVANKHVDVTPNNYTEVVIYWMIDNVFLIKRAAIKAKGYNNEKLNYSQDEDDHKYRNGKLIGYFEIITFMQKQAKKLGLSLKDINLEDINPNKDLK